MPRLNFWNPVANFDIDPIYLYIIISTLIYFNVYGMSELASHHVQRIRRLFQPFGHSKNSDTVVRTELNFGKRKSVSEVVAHFLGNHTFSWKPHIFNCITASSLNQNTNVYVKYFHQGSIRRRPICLKQTKKILKTKKLKQKTTLRTYLIYRNA